MSCGGVCCCRRQARSEKMKLQRSARDKVYLLSLKLIMLLAAISLDGRGLSTSPSFAETSQHGDVLTTSAVVITSPKGGAIVSGPVSITVGVSAAVKRVDFYVGTRYLASGPPYSYYWNAATVADGSHILSVRAYNYLNQRIATVGVNVHVRNGFPTPSPGPLATPTPTALSFSHVFLVMEENHSYADVVGNSEMPYLNSLIQSNGLATGYYANTHPSLPY